MYSVREWDDLERGTRRFHIRRLLAEPLQVHVPDCGLQLDRPERHARDLRPEAQGASKRGPPRVSGWTPRWVGRATPTSIVFQSHSDNIRQQSRICPATTVVIAKQRIHAIHRGGGAWFQFDIRQSVVDWISDPESNFGIQIVVGGGYRVVIDPPKNSDEDLYVSCLEC